jgi:hypothetical protein
MAGIYSPKESLRTRIRLPTTAIELTTSRNQAYSVYSQYAGLDSADNSSQNLLLSSPASAPGPRFGDPLHGLPHITASYSVPTPRCSHFAVGPEDHSGLHRYLFSQESGKRTRSLRQSTFRWLSEILSCVLSLLCVIAIAVVLAIYDGQLAPNWPLGITLNALLALLTSLAKLALLAPTMEGIGQLRWQWFSQQHRKLTDFDLFDQASRGTFGGLKLLVSLKGGWVTIIETALSTLSTVTG